MMTITVKNYFEAHIYYLGWMFLIAALIALVVKWYVGLILLLLAVTIITTSYRLTIDPEKKVIDDYLWFLGTKTQRQSIAYERLEYIFINQSRYTQQLNHKSISGHVSGVVYMAYLKSDVDNYFLGESKDIEKLRKRIARINQDLQLQVKQADPS